MGRAREWRTKAQGRCTMSAVRTGITPTAWLIAPSALLFALFFFLPMGLMAIISLLTGNPVVQPNVTFTGKYYQRILSDPYYFEVIWTTLRIGLLTTLAALLIGYPLAHWMARIRGRTAYAVLMMSVLTPMLTGIVVRTFAWMALLSDKGAINQTLTGLGLISKPLPLMYNEFSIVLGLTHIYVPYMVLTLVGVIGRVDERLEHAAQNLGASPLKPRSTQSTFRISPMFTPTLSATKWSVSASLPAPSASACARIRVMARFHPGRISGTAPMTACVAVTS